MNLPLEIKVIKNFVAKDKQSRYIQFISSNKARSKFINDLPHFNHFNWKIFEAINGNASDIISRLEPFNGNKKSCYVISENPSIDQQMLLLDEALRQIGGDMAIILVFGNAEMIYFEGEPPKNRYISKII